MKIQGMTPAHWKIAEALVAGKTHKIVAQELGICEKTILRRTADPIFKAQMEKLKMASIAKDMKAFDKVVKAQVDATPLPARVQMLAKLWEFVCVDPLITKGDTTSQREAWVELWGKLNFQGEESGNGEAKPAEPDVYVADWMRTKQ